MIDEDKLNALELFGETEYLYKEIERLKEELKNLKGELNRYKSIVYLCEKVKDCDKE